MPACAEIQDEKRMTPERIRNLVRGEKGASHGQHKTLECLGKLAQGEKYLYPRLGWKLR